MKVIVERSKRRTLSLTVSRGGEAVVRAPLSTSDAEIEAFLARHALWLKRRLAARRTLSLQDGERVTLFGTAYRIGLGGPRFAGSDLLLPAENREAAFCALAKKRCGEVMRRLTAELAARYGFVYGSVRITSARTRWGSCNRKGNLAYSFRTAFLPMELAEYVVLHELCHTLRLDHSAAFWREVERRMPDYLRRRKSLRGYEWCMEVL